MTPAQVRAFLAARGMTIDALAVVVETSRTYLSRVLNRQSPLPKGIAARIAQAMKDPA